MNVAQWCYECMGWEWVSLGGRRSGIEHIFVLKIIKTHVNRIILELSIDKAMTCQQQFGNHLEEKNVMWDVWEENLQGTKVPFFEPLCIKLMFIPMLISHSAQCT